MITIKKMEKGRFFIGGNDEFIVFTFLFLIIFPIAYITLHNFVYSLISALIISFTLILTISINDYFGKKMHAKIFKKKIFQNLMMKGFRKEEIGKYE